MRGDSGKPAKAAKEVNMPDTEMKWTMPGPDSTIARLLLWFQMSSHEGGDASFRLPSSLLTVACCLAATVSWSSCKLSNAVASTAGSANPLPHPLSTHICSKYYPYI